MCMHACMCVGAHRCGCMQGLRAHAWNPLQWPIHLVQALTEMVSLLASFLGIPSPASEARIQVD